MEITNNSNYELIFISIILILIFVVMHITYSLGKYKTINKQNKKADSLQYKIINRKYKKIRNKKELIDVLKKGKFIIIFCIIVLCSSCSVCGGKVYIPLQTYTIEEQEDLIKFLENNNVNIVDKMLIDYGELREVVRVVNGN